MKREQVDGNGTIGDRNSSVGDCMRKILKGSVCVILSVMCFGLVSLQNLNNEDDKKTDLLLQTQTVTSVYIMEHLTGKEKTLRAGYDDNKIISCLEILDDTVVKNASGSAYDVSIFYDDGSSGHYTITGSNQEKTEFFETIMNGMVTQL